LAVSTDLLNTTLQDLKGPIEQMFEQKTPLYNWLQKKGRVSTDKGIYVQRPIMGGSPAQGTGIFNGGETLNMVRVEQTKSISVQTHRAVIPINIPKLDMKQNDGKLGAVKLLEMYPATVNALLPADFDRFFLTGVSNGLVLQTSEMLGWNTFNGQKTFSSGKIGVTVGIFDLDNDPSAQTATSQNLAKSASYNYVNQRSVITSFAVDGKRKYRQAFRNAAQWIPSPDGVPDVCFVDFDSFALIEDEQDTHVRLTVQGDTSEKKRLLTTELSGVTMTASKNLVLTDFTGTAASGVAYAFSMDGIELVWYQKPEMSDFDDRVANQDVVTAKIEMMFALVVQGLRCQAVIVGGAQA
jgi:hypothetical protein